LARPLERWQALERVLCLSLQLAPPFCFLVKACRKSADFPKNNTSQLKTEKVKRYKIDKDTSSTVSHSCFRNYIINDGKTKYVKDFDLYDLTGQNNNLNYESNNNLSIVKLNLICEEIIYGLEKKKVFNRLK
jgi:hypothetical protein